MVDSTILASQERRPLIYVVLPQKSNNPIRSRGPREHPPSLVLPAVRGLFVRLHYYHPRSGDRSQLMVSIFQKINRSIAPLA